MINKQEQLTKCLSEAANGKDNALREFYELLLGSSVFYVPKISRKQNSPSIIGQEHQDKYGFETIMESNNEVLPIFTESKFIADWNDNPEVFTKEIEFNKLIWLIGNKLSLHLNPSQEVGKEISPWEIELLKQGKESIPELVSEQQEQEQLEVTIRSSADLFPELKTNLLPILEIYPELEEAFLVCYRENDDEKEQPILGIKYNKIDSSKRAYLKSEFENASKEFLANDQQLSIIDDLENKDSPNQKLFRDTTPFYFAKKIINKNSEGFLNKIKNLWK